MASIRIDDKRLNEAQAGVLISALRWGVIYPRPLKKQDFQVAQGTEIDQYHNPHVIERLTRSTKNHKAYLFPLIKGGYILTLEGKQLADELETMELSTGLRCSECNSYIWGEGKYHQWDMMWCDRCKEFTLWEDGVQQGVLA